MNIENIPLEQSTLSIRTEATKLLNRYWKNKEHEIFDLKISEATNFPNSLPPVFTLIKLPDWAHDCGVDGQLLVPVEWENTWDKIPWLHLAYWMIHAYPERRWEQQYGCIDSYSIRLRKWDERLWERAWVNRIALFLRRWAAHLKNTNEEILFGPLPKAELILTHDVDAIKKTLVIRFKQAAFNCFNACRLIRKGEFHAAQVKVKSALRFLLSNDDYMRIPYLLQLESACNVRSIFHFYAGKSGLKRPLRSILIDPGYDIFDKELKTLFTELTEGGWEIGLHPSALTWDKPEGIQEQKNNLEKAIGYPVNMLRQHWLRFSWEKTWEAQQKAGFTYDSTLGFNDRSGFRNSAALCIPLKTSLDNNFSMVPMFLMDSHLYDYLNVSHQERFNLIKYWLNELYNVSGISSIIWHTQVLGKDYGWAGGYETVLEYWRELNSNE